MNAFRYEVVFQFPETFFPEVGSVADFDAKLLASLPKTCLVDGNDTGFGTTNFFVYTNFPLAALKSFRKYLGRNKVEDNLRVSFREVDGETYVNIWPFRVPRPFALFYPDGIDPFSAKSKRLIPARSPIGVSKEQTVAALEWPTN